jgi:hypothetical protein
LSSSPRVLWILAATLACGPLFAADQYKRECGFGTTCAEANDKAVAECTKTGGVVLGIMGPCLQWMDKLRQCVTCKIAEKRELTACEKKAQALKAAIEGCGGRADCTVRLAPEGGGDPRELTLEAANAELLPVDTRATAEYRVRGIEERLPRILDTLRPFGVEPSAPKGAPSRVFTDAFLHAVVRKSIDHAATVLSLSMTEPKPGESAKSVKKLEAQLVAIPAGQWGATPKILTPLTALLASAASTSAGKEEIAPLVTAALKAGLKLGADEGASEESLAAVASLLKSALPAAVQGTFPWSEQALEAFAGARAAGLDLRADGDLTGRSAEDFEEIKMRSMHWKEYNEQLTLAKETVAQTPPCE